MKKVFQYVREALDLKGGTVRTKRLPELMSEDELNRFYKAVWQASNRIHMVMLKLGFFVQNREISDDHL